MIKIGIQGNIGSKNEEAARFFINKNKWMDSEIVPLINTESVLKSLYNAEIHYGVFAYESSRAGMVKETKEALTKYKVEKVDTVALDIDHALLANSKIDTDQKIYIYSHPQSLKEHKSYIEQRFKDYELVETEDTATAAKKLSENAYKPNSLVIAPKNCAKLYNLALFEDDLPTNKGYFTTFWLVKTHT
jgi:prephenate dehydratase